MRGLTTFVKHIFKLRETCTIQLAVVCSSKSNLFACSLATKTCFGGFKYISSFPKHHPKHYESFKAIPSPFIYVHDWFLHL